MDRRQGKRPLPSDHESEEKEKEEAAGRFFPVYSARSQQEMNTMVQALSQVIGNNNNNPLLQLHDHQNQSDTADQNQSQHQQAQDQGIYTHTYIYIYILGYFCFLPFGSLLIIKAFLLVIIVNLIIIN